MNCPHCTTSNDTDALFCAECGKRLTDGPGTPVRSQRRQYFLALLFVPVIILAAAIGYYKFILPDGIAAVVNGEKITLSELDAAVARMKGAGGEAPAGMRFQALNELISERLALQEAGRAGIAVSKEETATAVRNAQAASGLGDAAFITEMKALYGSARNFEKAMERSLIINRFLTERVIPKGADPGTAAQAINRWLQDLSGKASVRIALAENLSGPGCGCCGEKGGPSAEGRGRSYRECQTEKGRPAASEGTKAAEDAGLRYWHAEHGQDTVSARLRDFGCHVQVDIVQNEKIVGSLRYQDGNITEM